MCSQCQVFEKATGTNYKEGQECIYEDNYHEPKVLDSVLRFLYSLPYDVPSGENGFLSHAKAYAAGEYYGLETSEGKCRV